MNARSLHLDREKRDLRRRSILYVADILSWADEHRRRTGRFPQANSGVVGAKRDERWRNIDASLRQGSRGLPGGWSLARLLAERRGYRNRKALPRFKINTILEWADEHRERTGRFPQAQSGVVAASLAEKWSHVDSALQQGIRGLRGGSSLPRLLVKLPGVRRGAAMRALSDEKILR